MEKRDSVPFGVPIHQMHGIHLRNVPLGMPSNEKQGIVFHLVKNGEIGALCMPSNNIHWLMRPF
jgi:hypothetical protein